MASRAAAAFAGSSAWAWLPMAVLLRSGAAVREEQKGPESNPEWLRGFCSNQSVRKGVTNSNAVNFMKALGLNEETCHEEKIEEVCEAYYRDLKEAKEGGSTRAKGFQFLQTKRPNCNRYYAMKADMAYRAEHPPGNKIRRAAQVCEPITWHNCVQSTCPTYCILKDIADSNCNCNEMCYTTFTNMWKTGSLTCKPKPWSECIKDFTETLVDEGRIPELEAITREHILKCICVNRMVNDELCYTGSQGIQPNERWCDFNKNPSWAKLLKTKKPSGWHSDWKPGGHEPDCLRKETLADHVKKPPPMYCIWKELGLGGHDEETCPAAASS